MDLVAEETCDGIAEKWIMGTAQDERIDAVLHQLLEVLPNDAICAIAISMKMIPRLTT